MQSTLAAPVFTPTVSSANAAFQDPYASRQDSALDLLALGLWAEEVTNVWAEKGGFSPIQRNVHVTRSEIDTVSYNGVLHLAIEVKARTRTVVIRARDSFDRNKVRALFRALDTLILRTRLQEQSFRVDLATLEEESPEPTPYSYYSEAARNPIFY